MRRSLSLAPIALLLAVISMPADAAIEGKLGTAVVTGSVLIDGQNATGSVPLGPAARIASSEGSTVTLQLGGGGEVRMTGQADVIVADRGDSVFVQLICGDIVVNSSIPATVVSKEGGRVQVTAGKGSIMPATGKVMTVKQGKSKDFQPGESASTSGIDSTITVMSKAKCDCSCP